MLLWPEEHILFASQDAISEFQETKSESQDANSEFLVLRDLNVELQEKKNLYLFISCSWVFSQICKKPIPN